VELLKLVFLESNRLYDGATAAEQNRRGLLVLGRSRISIRLHEETIQRLGMPASIESIID
jgi:hypothetical protein